MDTLSDRAYWIQVVEKLSMPVLIKLAKGDLTKSLYKGEVPEGYRKNSNMEIAGRLLAGIAPWLKEPANGDNAEQKLHRSLTALTLEALQVGADPKSPDYFTQTSMHHHIVDAAFLAHAIVRAPEMLFYQLDLTTRQSLVRMFQEIRQYKPYFCNWLLFSAMIETALCKMGEKYDPMRIDYAIRQHEQWYLGDGTYGDGPEYRWDYYNSYVIQPMLIDIIETMSQVCDDWKSFHEPLLKRAQRYAAVQERLVAPDGSFPAIGRSITYRFGAFQLLSQMALRHELPATLPPAQARSALTAVIHRTMDAPKTFSPDGFLTIGLAGEQLGLGENYISVSATYLCATGLLALGLPSDNPFWKNPGLPWTAQRIWSGEDLPGDHA